MRDRYATGRPTGRPTGDDEGASAPASVQRTALDACTAVIAGPAPALAEIPERETLITTRWVHDELHDVMPTLPVHAIATYFGAPARRLWSCGDYRFDAVGHPGAIGVIPAGWGGRWDISGDSSVSYVFLSDARLQGFAEQWLPGARRVELLPCVGEQDEIAAGILSALARYAERPEPSAALFVDHALDLLSIHLVRKHSSFAKPVVPVPNRGLVAWQVRRVIGYMREHLDKAVTLEDLASQVNLSRFHFCTAFRLATGETPHEVLTELRMRRARELLADPRLTITEIGLAVGFKTPSAFSAAFCKATGRTPSGFRRLG